MMEKNGDGAKERRDSPMKKICVPQTPEAEVDQVTSSLSSP